VRSAIGFDEKRGDQLQVTNMRFAESMRARGACGATYTRARFHGFVQARSDLILSITALLVFSSCVKPMIRRLTTPVAPMAGGTALPAPGTPGAPQLTHAPGEAQPQPQQAGSPAQLGHRKKESMIDISQIDGQVRESSIRKVGDVVQAHPEEAMAILRTWLHQPV